MKLTSLSRALGLALSLQACSPAQQATEATPAATASAAESSSQHFTNPLFVNGADPWLEYWNGNYYLTTTTWTSQLVMRKSPTLAGLATATPVNVWSETNPKSCCNFWAFEFHRLQGPDGVRWYLMYTSGKQENLDGQHLSVLESAGDDPMGPYSYKGSPMPDGWNIDGNYLEHNGKLYLLWSEWVGDEQLNWISEMVNPWTLTGERMVLSRPHLPWEQSGRKVNEGPEVLKHNGRTFVVYSASFCDTPDYKLGVLELTGDNPMEQSAWKKYDQPFFERTDGVYGPGHNGFFTSPDGKERWLVYHGNNKETDGCGASRSVRAQPFSFDETGLPKFGKPVPEGTEVPAPSGENGPLVVRPEGISWALKLNNNQCLTAEGAGDCAQSHWVLDPTTAGRYRLVSAQGQVLNADATTGPWLNSATQQWQLLATEAQQWQLKNSATAELLSLPCDGGQCDQLQLLPQGNTVLSSRQSGKVLATAGCEIKTGTELVQQSWNGGTCQQWQWLPTAQGLHLKPASEPTLCVQVNADALAAGAPLVLGRCEAKSALWALQPQANGALLLQSLHSKQLLDLPSCALDEGVVLRQAPAEPDRLCQQFYLREPQ